MVLEAADGLRQQQVRVRRFDVAARRLRPPVEPFQCRLLEQRHLFHDLEQGRPVAALQSHTETIELGFHFSVVNRFHRYYIQ